METAAAEAAAAVEATTAPAPPADTWAAFGAAVSGEWEGVTASFDPDGNPIQLPEYYVPQVRWVGNYWQDGLATAWRYIEEPPAYPQAKWAIFEPKWHPAAGLP